MSKNRITHLIGIALLLVILLIGVVSGNAANIIGGTVKSAALSTSVQTTQPAPTTPQPAAQPPLGADSSGYFGASYPPAVFSKPSANGIITGYNVRHDTSPALRDITSINPSSGKAETDADIHKRPPIVSRPHVTDPIVQSQTGPSAMPTPIVDFQGIGQTQYTPPDTNGQVGLTQFVETVNAAFQVWDKTGLSLYGPAAISTIFSGFGGPCESGGVDPVALYDHLADRWVITDFTINSPYYECIAVSLTSDATGQWYRYAFADGTANLPDYPKLSVWPDAYYMTVDDFLNQQIYEGVHPFAFDRAKMLTGGNASYQFTANDIQNAYAMLPADLDGQTLPPGGTPDYFVTQDISDTNQTFFTYHVDWQHPANSIFTSTASLTPPAFNDMCPTISHSYCIPQPGTSNMLDSLNITTMFRGAYRIINGHDALLYTYTVDGGGQAGVRWYEVRNLDTIPSYYQAGTYAPDSSYRWMASAAMDGSGDIAVGFSVSDGNTTYPSVRYAGRLPGDPLGQLSQGETSLQVGAHSQTGSSRWGDYSDMTVDPSDDCTFWYTQEYMNSGDAWLTRIGAFRFPSCVSLPTPTPDTITPLPIPTNTPTVTHTPLPMATSTAVPPSNTPTATAVPATNTATSTAVPSSTAPSTPTSTSVPPTNTPTATSVVPTDTPTITATIVPPSVTPTITALPTTTWTPLRLTTTPSGPTNTATSTPLSATDPPTLTPVSATDTPSTTIVPPLPTATPTDCSNPFVDITGNIFYTAIHYLNCRSVVNGTDASHYSPAGTSTRGQFAKVVVLGFAVPSYTPQIPDFSDVPASYFAYLYIESGLHAGILSGFDQASCTAVGQPYPCYLPNHPITRGQLTKLVVNAAHYPLYTPTSGRTFADVPPSNVFFVSIETAHYKGVINGYSDHTFRPNNDIRRDEMAQIVYKGVITP